MFSGGKAQGVAGIGQCGCRREPGGGAENEGKREEEREREARMVECVYAQERRVVGQVNRILNRGWVNESWSNVTESSDHYGLAFFIGIEWIQQFGNLSESKKWPRKIWSEQFLT